MRASSRIGKPTAMLTRRLRPPDPMSPAEAERIYRDQRRTFLAALPAHLADAGVPCRLFNRGTRLAWRDPEGRLNEGDARMYSSPAHYPGAPLVLRAFVGVTSLRIPAAVYSELGITNRRHDGCRRELELSTLPDEFLSFVPWLAAWIIVRQARHAGVVSADVCEKMRRILDAPPFAFERVLGDVSMSNYLWTTTAARIHDEWYARRQARKARGRTMTLQVRKN